MADAAASATRSCSTAHPVALDTARFERHLAKSEVPLLVDFWAPWCGPCRMMAPEFERAAAQLEPAVRLVKVNVDQEPALAQRFQVHSIPTLLLAFQGREVARAAGARSAAQLVAMDAGRTRPHAGNLSIRAWRRAADRGTIRAQADQAAARRPGRPAGAGANRTARGERHAAIPPDLRRFACQRAARSVGDPGRQEIPRTGAAPGGRSARQGGRLFPL